MHEVIQLYARRWDIELIFLLLKAHFGLHIWWSSQQDLMLCQLWIALILAHLLTRLRFQVAESASVSSFDISIPVLMDLLRRFSQTPIPLVKRLANEGRFLKLTRTHSRIQLHIPLIGIQDIKPLPPDLHLLRTARYAGRNAHSRTADYTPLFTDQLLI
jgi:hypothetical protein